MSLKTSYFDGATGLHTKLNDAFDAGVAFVAANSAELTEELEEAAAAGKTSFTVTIETTFQPANLRLSGLLLKAYLAGITAGLAEEDIYSYECTQKLNTSDSVSTSIDFVFSFATA